MNQAKLATAVFTLLLNQKTLSSQYCIDFNRVLKKSLELFGLGHLAAYFHQTAAFISALLIFLFLLKSRTKYAALRAIISLPLTYFISLKIILLFTKNIMSYCYY